MLPVDDITQQQQQSFLASSSVQQMNNYIQQNISMNGLAQNLQLQRMAKSI